MVLSPRVPNMILRPLKAAANNRHSKLSARLTSWSAIKVFGLAMTSEASAYHEFGHAKRYRPTSCRRWHSGADHAVAANLALRVCGSGEVASASYGARLSETGWCPCEICVSAAHIVTQNLNDGRPSEAAVGHELAGKRPFPIGLRVTVERRSGSQTDTLSPLNYRICPSS